MGLSWVKIDIHLTTDFNLSSYLSHVKKHGNLSFYYTLNLTEKSP